MSQESEFVKFPELSEQEFNERLKKVQAGLQTLIEDLHGKQPMGGRAFDTNQAAIKQLRQLRTMWEQKERSQLLPDIDVIRILRELNLPGPLLLQLARMKADLNNDLSETYASSAPDKLLAQIDSEGRGAYRRHELQISSRSINVIDYVKGLGSKGLLDEKDDRIFPAFPTDPDDLFFDDTQGNLSGHPRIIGTETALWGAHEHINSIVLFLHAVRQFGITNLTEAINKGIPIPVGLKPQPDLSIHLQSLLAERYQKTNNWLEKINLQWIGNWQPFITVATAVPGSKRMSRLGDLTTQTEQEKLVTISNFTNEQRMRHLGKTWRRQLELGVLFSGASSHGQNIYNAPHSWLPLADYSDLIFLGAIKDAVAEDSDIGVMTSEQRRHYVLYNSLLSTDGLRPLPYPLHELGVSYETVLQANAVFWNELCKASENIQPDSETVSWLSIFFPEYFESALTDIILSESQEKYGDSWNDVGDIQLNLIKKHDWSGMLQETLEARFTANISEYGIGLMRGLRESDGTTSMRNFLLTDDVKHLEDNQELKPAVDIASLIHSLADKEYRNKLSEVFAKLQSSRSFQTIEEDGSLEHKHDMVYLFENRHYLLVAEFIHSNQLEAAYLMLHSLLLLETMKYVDAADFHPEGDRQDVKTWYAERLLLAHPSEMKEINEQIEYYLLVQRLFINSAGNIFFSAFSNDGIDVFDFAKKQHLTHPREMITNVLGTQYNNEAARKLVSYFIELRATIVKQFGSSLKNIDLIINELDEMTEEVSKNLPILRICHEMEVLELFRRHKPDATAGRFERFKQAYVEVENLKLPKSYGWEAIAQQRKNINWGDFFQDLEKRYKEKGYDRLAEYYQSKAAYWLTNR